MFVKEVRQTPNKQILQAKVEIIRYMELLAILATSIFYQQKKPYVAVVKDGAGIGRAMLLPAESSVIGTMQYLLPKSVVLPEYLFYVVKHMHLEKYFSGATIPHIYFRDYQNEEFTLDDLNK